MTGSDEATTTRLGTPLLSRLLPSHRRYVAADGGAGAHLLTELAGMGGRMEEASSPRHADLLIVVEPVSARLAPAVVEMARALPHPASVLVVGRRSPGLLPEKRLAPVDELLPGGTRLETLSADEVHRAALEDRGQSRLTVRPQSPMKPDTVPTPSREEREMGTEPAVISLGPLSPFTSGPLRVVLVCDGEQVTYARVDSGYAHRGIADAMTGRDWQEAADLASELDPLTPVTGRLAFVRAVEMVQGYEPPPDTASLREAALSLERARNHLWWSARLFSVLEARRLFYRTWTLARALSRFEARLWERPPVKWVAPQQGPAAPSRAALDGTDELCRQSQDLYQRVQRDRALALRTRGIGVLSAQQVEQEGVTGPVLEASASGQGDAHARILARLKDACAGLRQASGLLCTDVVTTSPPHWDVPEGEATALIEGPRGRLGAHVVSHGDSGPAHVQWHRPSAALLCLVENALAGQKLADAEVILASLDIAAAEADG